MLRIRSENRPSSVGTTSGMRKETVVVLHTSRQVTLLLVELPPQVEQPRDMVMAGR